MDDMCPYEEDEPTKLANLGTTDTQGRTTLHYASMKFSWWFRKLLHLSQRVNIQDGLGWTPLHFASSQDTDTNKVFELIQAGADVGIRSQDGMTPLHCAAMASSVDAAVELVNAGVDINGLDGLRNTALHWAAFSGHDEVVRHLLPLTNPTLRTIGGRTVLHQAALGGKCTALQLRSMLERGYKATTKDREGRTALHYAAWSGHGLAVSVLVAQFTQSGTDPDTGDKDDKRPVDFAASSGFQEIAIDLLLGDSETLRARREHRDGNGATILHHAAAGNCNELLRYLISEDHMSLSDTDISGNTALHYAARSGNKAALEVLVGNGADLTVIGGEGFRALHYAADNGHQDCVEYLGDLSTLREGQLPVTSDNETALHVAARAGHVDVVRSLLKQGCPIDHQGRDGTTALHQAAEIGDTATAKVLLEWEPQGARVNALTGVDNEPLAYAAMEGHLEMVKLLVRKGANVHNENKEGQTPFFVAAECLLCISGSCWQWSNIEMTSMEQRADILRFLVESGANPKAVDKRGNTAHQLLLCRRFHEIENEVENEVEDGRKRRLMEMYLEALSLTGSP